MSIQHSIQVDGATLKLRVAGRGPAVLLVHGFPDDHRVWREQVPALVEAGYRVIVPDLRGCGDSTAPRALRAYRLDRLVADLVTLLDALNVQKVQLIAHDWGAVIGWQLAMRHPERVERYAALSVGHPLAYARSGIEQKLKGWYVLMFQLRGVAEVLLRARGWALFRLLTQHPGEAPHWIERLRRPGRLSAALNYYRANLGILLRRAYPPVKVPVMGLWSDGDRFLSEQQMLASAALVNAAWRYERIEGASHWLQLDAAARVNALLLDFLSQPIVNAEAA